jgi:hypothetical protein
MWIQDDSGGYRWLQISQFLQPEHLCEADAESAGPEAPGRKPMEAPYVAIARVSRVRLILKGV